MLQRLHRWYQTLRLPWRTLHPLQPRPPHSPVENQRSSQRASTAFAQSEKYLNGDGIGSHRLDLGHNFLSWPWGRGVVDYDFAARFSKLNGTSPPDASRSTSYNYNLYWAKCLFKVTGFLSLEPKFLLFLYLSRGHRHSTSRERPRAALS